MLRKKNNIPETVFIEFQKQIERRIKVIQTQLNDTPYSTINPEFQAMRTLTLTAIESEKSTLFRLRKLGNINDEVFHMLLGELDIEEMRAKTIRV